MITALLFLVPNVTAPAPPIEYAVPATRWSCSFNALEGNTFTLGGFFAEIPAGTDPSIGISTNIVGSGPSDFLGSKMVRPGRSINETRSYFVSFAAPSGYFKVNLSLNDSTSSRAMITQYIFDKKREMGMNKVFATGTCQAKFHPLGYQGTGE